MNSRWVVIGAVGVAALSAIAGVGWLYFLNFTPDRTKYPVRGIDVSHHQGMIDWQRVRADDVAFAILKATEGGDHVDRYLAANLDGARSAGLAVGVYHFFTFCRPGAEQAANFLASVPRDRPMLPPVVDIEFSGNCSVRPTASELGRELAAFLGPIETAFGREAMVYLIGDAYREYRSVVPERLRWVRWLAMEPLESGWTYWQYHDRGHVDGIDGEVDLNVLNGGADALSALVK